MSYKAGWDIGMQIARNTRLTLDDLNPDERKNFLEGFAAGVDQEINYERYAAIEQQRVVDDLAAMADEVPEMERRAPHYVDRRASQEFHRRIQAERIRRCFAGVEGMAAEIPKGVPGV